ncbi:hypothetical protein [Bacteroides xylanisolvens]|nr:hypothetical protein [Bacteroides xylanisolvens]
MKKSIIIILAVVVILVIWAVSVYNGNHTIFRLDAHYSQTYL